MKPTEQIKDFLVWFCKLEIQLFDIHIRLPKTPFEDYKSGNWIWLTHHEQVTENFIVSRLVSWLRHKNANGADIFFRPHKDDCHPVIFLDDVPIKKARAISRKYGSSIVETHPGNTQIWLQVDKNLSTQQRKQAQIILKNLGVTDPGSISGNHLGRLCGMRSQKRNCWVNLISTTNMPPWSPNLNFDHTSYLSPSGVFCASKKSFSNSHIDTSNSGKEWGWVMGMLRAGQSSETVTEKLVDAATKRGKCNPVQYARYTVKKAVNELK